MEQGLNDIDRLLREEKRLSAVESYEDAWAEGRAAGIEADIMAEAAIATALGELIRASDEAGALALLERMRDRLIAGEFDSDLRIH
ncbi:hypothetical protein [Aerobium aerolatum]|uniref:Uncharacterized protein n=1 Tax=Aquamicrobium aerolatum DSM 21857 TaxID=1121003 RepID=A0A1I3N4U9_9HYPH|nr:hypothetical protein [Aquamicrobium aerolatum]SFJ04261.1 hypothetical protein SAMN03080618_01950 [Aquamicrobium aerolatum DSM 21857]